MIEVGIGGLLDTTNNHHEVSQSITSIGLDHQGDLGNDT